jgi:hypothetical protein
MPLFRIQVFYQQGTGIKWTNVYHVDAVDLFTAAAAASGTLAPALAPFLHVSAQIVKTLTSDPTTPGSFIEDALGIVGSNGDVGQLLPLFNSIRVLFPILSGGRPDYKFVKGLLTEGMQNNGLIDASVLTALETGFTSLISAMSTAGANLVSDTLEGWATVTAQEAVQMRQLHRRRRRAA